MSNIGSYLDNIEKARFGKDVRSSIVEAIKEIDSVADTAKGSATYAANTAIAQASQAVYASDNATQKANEALASANEAKMYAQNASAVTGVEISTTEKAGLVKGGENTIGADGTLELTRTTAERTLSNSYAGGLKINAINGKSEQDSTTGAQLLDPNSLTDTTYGFSVDEDGWITVTYDNSSGTSTKFPRPKFAMRSDLKVSTNYLVVCEIREISGGEWLCPTSGNTTGSNITGQFKTENHLYEIGTHIYTATTRDDFTDCDILLRTTLSVPAGTIGTFKFRISLYEDTSITADTFVYEKFTGGQPSPSPQYEQEIRSTVISEVRSCGAQLCDYSGFTSTNATCSIDGDTIKVTSLKAYSNIGVNIKNPKAYIEKTITVSYESIVKTNESASGMVQTIVYKTDGTKTYVQHEKSFIVPKNVESIKVTIYAHNNNSNLETENTTTVKGLMVNVGDTALPWEEYQETVATLSEPITLYGIPTTSGGNFTDSNGQQWIADYIDVAKGKVVRCVNSRTISSVSDVKLLSSGLKWRGSYIVFDSFKNKGANVIYNIINTKFTQVLQTDENAESTGTCMSAFSHTDSLEFRFRLMASEYATEEDVQNAVSGTIVYYPLATPTEEDLPTADVVALRSLVTFDTVTHVSTDSEVEPNIVSEYGTSKIGGHALEALNTAQRNEINIAELTNAVLALNQE